MTDKQIIINGVDVSGCSGYCSKLGKYNCIALAWSSAWICKQSPNCYYKQLQRRIAECEELKDKIKKLRKNLALEIETNDRYRKALEEIEKVINNILNSCLGRNTVGCRPAHNVCGDLIKILDIINKAKGDNR